ncbi:MAG: sigma-54 dependent transcriptional regulator [Gammaproteobacteria bacterium]|nr:sigma-54 dependent transcriptional regulator [Gammaproteobacteria bacterium]
MSMPCLRMGKRSTMKITDNKLVGNSVQFQTLLNTARVVGCTDVCVLLQGESGTGKELLARELHLASPRKSGAFVAVDCASLPENLVESELFGHRKGAFTGADRNYTGRIQAAEGGTLFLDEIGELPLSIQAKFLRFLELGMIQPLGEAQPRKVNTRVIAATHRNLAEMVRQGTFRQDLFYRLNIVPLELPPLRERSGDVAALLDYFSKQLAASHGLQTPVFAKSALKQLHSYRWPGNVRELRNFCERMVILFSGKTVELENLPAEIRGVQTGTKPGFFSLPQEGICLAELEQMAIEQALQQCGGNRSRAARLLNLSRDTLLYRMKKYELRD